MNWTQRRAESVLTDRHVESIKTDDDSDTGAMEEEDIQVLK
jgi:hypothetical protein